MRSRCAGVNDARPWGEAENAVGNPEESCDRRSCNSPEEVQTVFPCGVNGETVGGGCGGIAAKLWTVAAGKLSEHWKDFCGGGIESVDGCTVTVFQLSSVVLRRDAASFCRSSFGDVDNIRLTSSAPVATGFNLPSSPAQ